MRIRANGLMLAGRLAEAELVLRRVLAQPEAGDDASLVIATRRDLTAVLFALGRMSEAARSCELAATAARAARDRRATVWIACQRASILASTGQLSNARDTIRGVQELAASDPLLLAKIRANLGSLALEAQAYSEAIGHYREAISIYHVKAARLDEAICAGYLGTAQLALGDYEAAHDHVEAALRDARYVGHVRAIGLFSAILGAISAARGALDRARALAIEADRLLVDDPLLGHVAAIYAGYLDLARANDARTSDAPRHVRRHWLAAVERLVTASSMRVTFSRGENEGARLLSVSDDARIATQLLRGALLRESLEERDTKPIRVGFGGGWFAIGDEPRVALEGRPVTRTLLWALAVARFVDPTTRLTTPQLIGAIWPGEVLASRVAASRLYVAIAELRRLGLGDHLASGRLGYAITDDVIIELD